MLRVFFILCFCVWFGVFCRFFAVLLFLGPLFEKFSGANFCFWVSLLVLCFLVGFGLCFCFMFWRVAPKVFGKILLMSGLLFLKKFSGANFCFLGVGLGHVFVGAVLLMFLLYVLAARSRRCLEKFS